MQVAESTTVIDCKVTMNKLGEHHFMIHLTFISVVLYICFEFLSVIIFCGNPENISLSLSTWNISFFWKSSFGSSLLQASSIGIYIEFRCAEFFVSFFFPLFFFFPFSVLLWDAELKTHKTHGIFSLSEVWVWFFIPACFAILCILGKKCIIVVETCSYDFGWTSFSENAPGHKYLLLQGL